MTTPPGDPWVPAPYATHRPYGYVVQRPPRNGLGFAALVVGLVGFFTSFVVVGAVIGAVGIALGIAGVRRARRGEATNNVVAILGIVFGSLAVVVGAVVLAVVVSSGYVRCVVNADTPAEERLCDRLLD